jgi:hypothetical protein
MEIKRLLEKYNKLKKNSNCQQAWFAQKIQLFRTNLDQTFKGNEEFSDQRRKTYQIPERNFNVISKIYILHNFTNYSKKEITGKTSRTTTSGQKED